MTHLCSRVFVSLCLLIVWKGTVFCQVDHNIRFTSITNTDGLPNNSINTIATDDLGFVWIGTNDGLCRYEGPNSIRTYRANDPPIEGGLQSSNVRALLLDSKNNLWIGTRLGGLTRFHQASGSWKTFRNDVEDPTSLSNDEVLTITEDSKGRIWVGTEDGLNVYDENADSFFSFKVDSDKPGTLLGKAVLAIFEDDKGWIWVGTWDGGLSLLRLPQNGNIKEGQFQVFFPNKKKPASRVWEIYQDKQNRYWLGTAGAGLFLMHLPLECHNKIDGLDWKPTFYNYANNGTDDSITNDDIKKILQDRNGNLWVATVNGLNCILAQDIKELPRAESTPNRYQLKFCQRFHEPSNLSSLINSNVRTLFEDSQGIIWAGTYGGISQYNWATNQFDVHEWATNVTKHPLSQNLYIDPDGVVWFGNGERGILKCDIERDEKIEVVNIGLTNNFISSLYSPDDKQLYIGHRSGVSSLEMKTGKVKHYPIFEAAQHQRHHLPIRSLYRDSQDQIWVGTEHGLFVIDERTGLSKLFTTDIDNPKSISDNTVNQIYEDSRGDFWLATFQGLNKVVQLQAGQFEFEHFKFDASNPDHSIPSNRIFSIAEVDGILYVATGSGLSGYDLEKKAFINYSQKDNKYSFLSIVKTSDGNIWGSTTEGIVQYNTRSNTFNRYDKRDGLGDIAFLLRSSFIDKDGWLYFGSRSGVTRFDPAHIVKNEVPPPVYVTDIRKMSPKGEVLSNATYANEIVLEHNEYYLAIDYAAINYNRSEKNQYAFMLEGLDDKWNYLSKKSPAIYTNLKHGSYYFKVKAANNDGVWNEVETRLKIVKKPAFWETWWFRIGCLLVLALIVILGVKYYTRNIKERNRILQKYNEDLNKEIAQRKLVEAALQKQKLVLKESNANLERSNKDLERSNKDLEEFAYIASHDLQEPLRVVGNFVGLLKHRYSKHFDEDAFQYIDFVVKGVSRMSEQIKSILTFSRVSQHEIEFQLTKLNDVVAHNLHDLSQKIEEKKVHFNLDELPEIYCDRNLIKMVFHNLISNAIKFNESEDPIITITHDPNSQEDCWQFSVKDNGIGIHEDYQIKIFEIFKRLHSRKDYEGTGIGLALCQKIIYRHGGEIWLESKEGEGTTFHFTIARVQPTTKNKKRSKATNEG
ncbi:MAG: hypothetical protein KTR30_23580 [Saprospiraceae bacterium]|nr:hypothetical protein [Saprospiraceae bacterium]